MDAGTEKDMIEDLMAELATAHAKIAYWQGAYKHCLHVKGSCSCQGRAEKLWCQRCKYITKYEQETGNKCR